MDKEKAIEIKDKLNRVFAGKRLALLNISGNTVLRTWPTQDFIGAEAFTSISNNDEV